MALLDGCAICVHRCQIVRVRRTCSAWRERLGEAVGRLGVVEVARAREEPSHDRPALGSKQQAARQLSACAIAVPGRDRRTRHAQQHSPLSLAAQWTRSGRFRSQRLQHKPLGFGHMHALAGGRNDRDRSPRPTASRMTVSERQIAQQPVGRLPNLLTSSAGTRSLGGSRSVMSSLRFATPRAISSRWTTWRGIMWLTSMSRWASTLQRR